MIEAQRGLLRIGFTPLFKSPTPHEILPREILQRRLLLCLFGLGTNAGIKRVASGSQTESYRDLLYVLQAFPVKTRNFVRRAHPHVLDETSTLIHAAGNLASFLWSKHLEELHSRACQRVW